MILRISSFIVLFVVFTGCCHHGVTETSQPMTNHPEILGYKQEFEPDPNEDWWKVCIYDTLKDCADEYNQR